MELLLSRRWYIYQVVICLPMATGELSLSRQLFYEVVIWLLLVLKQLSLSSRQWLITYYLTDISPKRNVIFKTVIYQVVICSLTATDLKRSVIIKTVIYQVVICYLTAIGPKRSVIIKTVIYQVVICSLTATDLKRSVIIKTVIYQVVICSLTAIGPKRSVIIKTVIYQVVICYLTAIGPKRNVIIKTMNLWFIMLSSYYHWSDGTVMVMEQADCGHFHDTVACLCGIYMIKSLDTRSPGYCFPSCIYQNPLWVSGQLVQEAVQPLFAFGELIQRLLKFCLFLHWSESQTLFAPCQLSCSWKLVQETLLLLLLPPCPPPHPLPPTTTAS